MFDEMTRFKICLSMKLNRFFPFLAITIPIFLTLMKAYADIRRLEQKIK